MNRTFLSWGAHIGVARGNAMTLCERKHRITRLRNKGRLDAPMQFFFWFGIALGFRVSGLGFRILLRTRWESLDIKTTTSRARVQVA